MGLYPGPIGSSTIVLELERKAAGRYRRRPGRAR